MRKNFLGRILAALALVFAFELAMANAAGCSHAELNAFETCLKASAIRQANSRVQAAIVCHGDSGCVRDTLKGDAEIFADEAAMCAADLIPSADGGGQ